MVAAKLLQLDADVYNVKRVAAQEAFRPTVETLSILSAVTDTSRQRLKTQAKQHLSAGTDVAHVLAEAVEEQRHLVQPLFHTVP